MTSMLLRLRVPVGGLGHVAALLLVLQLPAATWGQDALDQNQVYRVNPPGARLEAVPPGEVRPGLVYKYYNQRLSQHVWGLATEEGGFRFALGPGSMQPAERFDLQLSARERQQILEQEAPGLSKGVEKLGRDVFLKLDVNDDWQLYHASSIPKVFDRLTGRRWEWHASRRVGVLHTTGAIWRWHNGRHYPANGHLR